MMKLKPSEVYYSQDSISDTFQNGKLIGVVLDDIMEGKTPISNIPKIRVARVPIYGNKWFSEDNRRLWLFRELERHGKCTVISVKEEAKIPSGKLTTKDKGVPIRIRGQPGGKWAYVAPESNHHWISVDEDSYDSVDVDEQSEDYSDDYM